ncbi:MAG TPA: acyl carrier protein [Ramlibacter sp.]|nr:acyl carrier protein [Ramlibacter sp.]
MSDHIAEELIRVIRKYGDAGNKGAITLDTPLEETGVDSLGMAEAMFELEDIFKITMPDPAAGEHRQTRRVGDLHAVIAGLVATR